MFTTNLFYITRNIYMCVVYVCNILFSQLIYFCITCNIGEDMKAFFSIDIVIRSQKVAFGFLVNLPLMFEVIIIFTLIHHHCHISEEMARSNSYFAFHVVVYHISFSFLFFCLPSDSYTHCTAVQFLVHEFILIYFSQEEMMMAEYISLFPF